VPIVGVFELRASAKTHRSNAAAMGFGRTRRVLVTDTLLQAFSPEEIETVLAHELAHQRNRDPIRGFVGGSLVSLAILAAAAWTDGCFIATPPAATASRWPARFSQPRRVERAIFIPIDPMVATLGAEVA